MLPAHTGVLLEGVKAPGSGLTITVVAADAQPSTVTLYVPAAETVMLCVFAPVLQE